MSCSIEALAKPSSSVHPCQQGLRCLWMKNSRLAGVQQPVLQFLGCSKLVMVGRRLAASRMQGRRIYSSLQSGKVSLPGSNSLGKGSRTAHEISCALFLCIAHERHSCTNTCSSQASAQLIYRLQTSVVLKLSCFAAYSCNDHLQVTIVHLALSFLFNASCHSICS